VDARLAPLQRNKRRINANDDCLKHGVAPQTYKLGILIYGLRAAKPWCVAKHGNLKLDLGTVSSALLHHGEFGLTKPGRETRPKFGGGGITHGLEGCLRGVGVFRPGAPRSLHVGEKL
jgi:hypothetical protein